MCKITLIRHGQASFGAENYDKLSHVGKEQAAALGDYFKENSISFDAIIHGKMSRQTETAQIMAKAMNFTDNLILDEGANEFDSDYLLKHYLPILANQSKELHQIIFSNEKWFANTETFEFIFRKLIMLWQQDDNCPFESWGDFKERVFQILNRIQAQYSSSNKKLSNQKIALVTSGGLISVTVQTILAAEKSTFMDMNLTINNASITEILIKDLKNTESKINARLLGFNNISPLIIKNEKHLITRK